MSRKREITGWKCFYCDVNQFFAKSADCTNMWAARQQFIKQMNVPQSHHSWVEVEPVYADNIQRSGTG